MFVLKNKFGETVMTSTSRAELERIKFYREKYHKFTGDYIERM